MKKLLYIAFFSVLLLSGCAKKTAETAPASLFLLTDGVTEAGIKAGDGASEFIKAYKGYTIQVAYSDLDSGYLVMAIDEIPYEDNISAIIANFFIDDEPVAESTLCEENDISPGSLHDLLSSPAYLRAHEVVYRYLRFQWEGGVIKSIQSDELNYNETFDIPRVE